MYQLYYAPDNASLVLRLALEEAALPYDAILVDRAGQGQRAPEYLALNPTGQIPTLVTPAGVMTETAACLLWMSDTHPQAGLGPAPQDAARGAFLRWLFFLSNTVHSDLNRIFYADRFVPADAIEAHHLMIAKRLLDHFTILDQTMQAQPSLFTPPSALALYLCPMLRWSALYPAKAARWLTLSDFPALFDLTQRMEARASARTAATAEGLGKTPFSQPSLPQPPEGSAT